MAKVAKAETQSWLYVGRDDFDLSLTTYKHSHSWSHSDRINLEDTAFFPFPNHSHFTPKCYLRISGRWLKNIRISDVRLHC